MSVFGVLADAASSAPSVTPFEQYIGPTSGVAIFGGLLYYIVKAWKDGRAQDVAGAKAKQAEAEKEAADLKTDYASQLTAMREELTRVREQATTENQQLREDVRKLQDQLQQLRDEQLAELRRRDELHQREMEIERNRTLKQTRIAFRLQQALAEAGVPLPADLDPTRPDVRPRLAMPGDDEDSVL